MTDLMSIAHGDLWTEATIHRVQETGEPDPGKVQVLSNQTLYAYF